MWLGDLTLFRAGVCSKRCAVLTCEAIYFSRGLSIRPMFSMPVLGRCSPGESSLSSNLPLKLWTTHTTYNTHRESKFWYTHIWTHVTPTIGSLPAEDGDACNCVSRTDRHSRVVGWIKRVTRVCRSHMCALTFPWGCCTKAVMGVAWAPLIRSKTLTQKALRFKMK